MHGLNIVYVAVIDNTNSTILKVLDNKNLGTNTAFKMSQKSRKNGDTIDILSEISYLFILFSFSGIFLYYGIYVNCTMRENNHYIKKNEQKLLLEMWWP